MLATQYKYIWVFVGVQADLILKVRVLVLGQTTNTCWGVIKNRILIVETGLL
jgi:hypothetical protein